jgi:shikimate dehydrogenase
VLTRLGVAGWPVRHSLSPVMQNAALRAAGLYDWHYQRLPLPPQLFEETVRALPGTGFRGINVTIPHKEAALAIADEADETARAVGAANTLTFEDGRILASNTDVAGLQAVLPIDPAGRKVLVLGAGGAGRAAVYALVRMGADVQVWNRTRERAEIVAAELGGRAVERPDCTDFVINCTSVGLPGGQPALKELPLQVDTWNAGSLVVDMVYGTGDTELISAARSRGAQVVDGLEILIAQGAASFRLWTGRTAPVQTMRDAVGNLRET